ncbi:MAG: lipoyl synthase [Nanoarchaeota archaeon]|nr:lipoyl synthase [Nanoarchaeota archaeon]
MTTPKPEWLRVPIPEQDYAKTKEIVGGITTVCAEAHCPNIAECWSLGTATFMVLGDTCTRSCKFCAVKTGFPAHTPDFMEPTRVADAAAQMNLSYVVLTSVDRDDLQDQGAAHLAACITAVKQRGMHVEVLIPDFSGRTDLMQLITDTKPDVIGHNIETVPRLQSKVRDPRANYQQSLDVLRFVKQQGITTKSSLMLGLGERKEEIEQVMRDLRAIGVAILTFGQYLQPSEKHLPVIEYVHPNVFAALKKRGEKLGFRVASAPFVRSSYRAGEMFKQQQ